MIEMFVDMYKHYLARVVSVMKVLELLLKEVLIVLLAS